MGLLKDEGRSRAARSGRLASWPSSVGGSHADSWSVPGFFVVVVVALSLSEHFETEESRAQRGSRRVELRKEQRQPARLSKSHSQSRSEHCRASTRMHGWIRLRTSYVTLRRLCIQSVP